MPMTQILTGTAQERGLNVQELLRAGALRVSLSMELLDRKRLRRRVES